MDLVERNEDLSFRHPWELSRCRHFINVLGRFGVSDPARCLDIGSGDAWVARNLKESLPPGSTMTCWDINYTSSDIAELAGSADGAGGLSLTADPPEGSFDGIFLLDVLEHIEDDCSFLRQVVDNHLDPAGWLLMSVPAYQSVFTRYDKFLSHYRRYSPKQGRSLLEGAGLRVKVEGGLFHALLPLRFVQVVWERVTKPRSQPGGLGGWRRGATATRLVTTALDTEAKLSLELATKTSFVVPGLSYWAFCTKAEAP